MTHERNRPTMWNSDITAPPQAHTIKILTVKCYHCGMDTNFTPDRVVDAECDMWRDRLHQMMGFFNGEVEKYHAKHGLTPAELEWVELMGVMKAMINRMKDGEGWKKP